MAFWFNFNFSSAKPYFWVARTSKLERVLRIGSDGTKCRNWRMVWHLFGYPVESQVRSISRMIQKWEIFLIIKNLIKVFIIISSCSFLRNRVGNVFLNNLLVFVNFIKFKNKITNSISYFLFVIFSYNNFHTFYF